MNIAPYITLWSAAANIWSARCEELKLKPYALHPHIRSDDAKLYIYNKKHRRKNCCPIQFELEVDVTFFFPFSVAIKRGPVICDHWRAYATRPYIFFSSHFAFVRLKHLRTAHICNFSLSCSPPSTSTNAGLYLMLHTYVPSNVCQTENQHRVDGNGICRRSAEKKTSYVRVCVPVYFGGVSSPNRIATLSNIRQVRHTIWLNI